MSSQDKPADARVSANVMPRAVALAGGIAVAAVVLVAYYPALKVSFVGDDWIFYELAGRLNLLDYLVKYFDPRVQTAWYRPVQGILFRIGYLAFGTNMVGYHLVNVLYHLANAWLLAALAARVTRRPTVGWLSGLLFASFPIAVQGVFWPGVIDPVTTLGSLAALWFWLNHLERGRRRDYALTLAAFLAALLSKEIGLLLPVTLFLADRLWVGRPATVAALARRYAGFVLIWAAYLPVEYIVTRRSVFVSREGYQAGSGLVSNLLGYAAGWAWPWSTQALAGYAALGLGAALLIATVFNRRHLVIVPVLFGALAALLPTVPFPQVSYRFLYLPLAGSAVIFGLILDQLCRHFSPRWARSLALAPVVLAVAAGSLGVSQAAADFGEFGRVSRVAFRNISQAHPTWPNDTFLYFIDPPIPGPNLSGMFFWRYGPGISTGANDGDAPARLRSHAAAFVYLFNQQGDAIEQRVDAAAGLAASPGTPVEFAAPVQLEGFEIARATVTRGDPFLVLLYWRASAPVDKDYAVSVRLLDSQGRPVASSDHAPGGGKGSPRAWTPGQRVVDAFSVAGAARIEPGEYRLEIGLYDEETKETVALKNRGSQDSVDAILMGPLTVTK